MNDEITLATERLLQLHDRDGKGGAHPPLRPAPVIRSAGGAAIPSRGPARTPSRGGGEPRPGARRDNRVAESGGPTPAARPLPGRRRRWPPDLAAIPVFAARMAGLASIRTRPRSTT